MGKIEGKPVNRELKGTKNGKVEKDEGCRREIIKEKKKPVTNSFVLVFVTTIE
jgi:hypothetical protein